MFRLFLCVFALPAIALAQSVPPSPAPQPDATLPRMLDIRWSAAPRLPQGMQDNDGGVIDDYLVMVGGFCHGIDDDWKPGRYPRGFLNKAWALALKNESRGWIELPDFPGTARQEMYGISVDNAIYLWGGFNYSEPYSYTDGYKLIRANGSWVWSELPPLLRRGAAGCLTSVGTKIYLLGGMDYDAQSYHVSTDRTGKIERYGCRMYTFDTEKPDAGWHELPSCPGAPRMMQGFSAVEGQVYVLGGYGVSRDGRSHNVVDCWRFDPSNASWHRLRDMPVAVAGSGSGPRVFKNRYVLLATGFPYGEILNPDETVRPRYGTPSRVDRSGWKQHPRLEGTYYANHVWVYDTKTDLFGTAPNLPYDDHCPATHVMEDTVYMFPGETAGFWWEGEYFGHAAEFVLKGKIRELNWQ